MTAGWFRLVMHRTDVALMALVLGPEPTYSRAGAAEPPRPRGPGAGHQPGGAS